MRIIEQADFKNEEGTISLQDRIRGTLTYGFSWFPEINAQAIVTSRLEKTLGADSTLIRNLKLPRKNITVPMILLGPQGVRVIVPSPLRGVFRAKGGDWQSFNGRSRSFKRTRPNMLESALNAAQAVHDYLKGLGYELPEVEPILIFSNPRTHVDTVRPSVRVVQRDGIDHFAASLLKLPPILDMQDIRELSDVLIKEPEQKAEPKPEERRPAPPPPAEAAFEVEEDQPRPAGPPPVYGVGRYRLTRNQWVLLGLLGLLNLIILLALAALIYSNVLFA